MTEPHNPLNTCDTLPTQAGDLAIFRLDRLEGDGIGPVSGLPFSVCVLLEAALRHLDGYQVREEDVRALANWRAADPEAIEIPFKPVRVVLQDFTGVPSLHVCISVGEMRWDFSHGRGTTGDRPFKGEQ